jgi:hypothetical protein
MRWRQVCGAEGSASAWMKGLGDEPDEEEVLGGVVQPAPSVTRKRVPGDDRAGTRACWLPVRRLCLRAQGLSPTAHASTPVVTCALNAANNSLTPGRR